MTGVTGDRCLALAMAPDAVAHLQGHGPPRHGLMGDITVAGCAVDVGAHVGRVNEPDVRRRRMAEHRLPGRIPPARLERGNLLNARRLSGDADVAVETEVDARKTGDWPAPGILVTLEARQAFFDVGVMRKV